MKTYNQNIEYIILGIKRTIPFIVLYSIILAISNYYSSLDIVAEYIIIMIVPVLAFNITYAYSKYYFMVPSILLGYYASISETGLLGGILIGITIGIIGKYFLNKFKQQDYAGVVIIIVINIVMVLLGYALLLYLIIPLITLIMNSTFSFLSSIDLSLNILIVAIVAFLITLDLGGPFNKIAFTFMIQNYLEGNYQILGPALVAVAIAPTGLLLSMYLYKNRYSNDDHTQKKLLIFSSIVGLSEGAMTVTFRRAKRILPVLILGSITGSVVAAIFKLESNLIMGAIPGVVGTSNIWLYLLAHAIGVLLIIILIPFVLKKETI